MDQNPPYPCHTSYGPHFAGVASMIFPFNSAFQTAFSEFVTHYVSTDILQKEIIGPGERLMLRSPEVVIKGRVWHSVCMPFKVLNLSKFLTTPSALLRPIPAKFSEKSLQIHS